MLAVVLVLAGLLVVAGLSLTHPSPRIAVALAVLSAAWLPINNGHLEGPVLYTVADDHGLTLADLAAYAGFALAAVAGWRWRRTRIAQAGPGARELGRPAAAAFVAVLVVLLGCGLAASWFHHKDHARSASARGHAVSSRGVAFARP